MSNNPEQVENMYVPLIDLSVLEIIKPRMYNFQYLLSYCQKYVTMPGELLTTEGISQIYNLVEKDPSIRNDLTTFVDMLSLINILSYGGRGLDITNVFLNALDYNRTNTVSNINESKFNREAEKGEVDIVKFLSRHPLLLAFYIFSMIAFFFELDIPPKVDQLGGPSE